MSEFSFFGEKVREAAESILQLSVNLEKYVNLISNVKVSSGLQNVQSTLKNVTESIQEESKSLQVYHKSAIEICNLYEQAERRIISGNRISNINQQFKVKADSFLDNITSITHLN